MFGNQWCGQSGRKAICPNKLNYFIFFAQEEFCGRMLLDKRMWFLNRKWWFVSFIIVMKSFEQRLAYFFFLPPFNFLSLLSLENTYRWSTSVKQFFLFLVCLPNNQNTFSGVLDPVGVGRNRTADHTARPECRLLIPLQIRMRGP